VTDAGTSATETKRYVWGNDLSGNLHGAGGVGGLLAMESSTGRRFYAYDGNGNVRALVKADTVNPAASTITARYAYDGFGREVSATGVDAGKNAFRFSTKLRDVESGMNYYGYRYYAARNGRWINRDPIMEKGGLNVYAMVRNEVIMKWDLNGLASGPVGNLKNMNCDQFKDALKDKQNELDKREQDLKNDKNGLYETCPTGKGSWQGHQQQFRDTQNSIKN